MQIAATPAINKAVAAAQDVPTLINELNAVDPTLAQQIEGKALLASKSPWGTLATAVVAYGVSKYALGWDQSTDELVAGAGLVAGSYAMRWISSCPISGLWKKAAAAPVAAPATPATPTA